MLSPSRCLRTHWERRIDKSTRRQSERTDMMSWGDCMSAWAKADTFWRQEGQGPSRSNWAELSMIKWHSSAAWERRSRHSHMDCSESKPCCTSGCSMRMAIMKQLRACNKMRSAQVKPGLAGTLQRLACTLSCFFDEFIMTNAPAPRPPSPALNACTLQFTGLASKLLPQTKHTSL